MTYDYIFNIYIILEAHQISILITINLLLDTLNLLHHNTIKYTRSEVSYIPFRTYQTQSLAQYCISPPNQSPTKSNDMTNYQFKSKLSPQIIKKKINLKPHDEKSRTKSYI